MIDTSVMVAGLVAEHAFHERARPYVRAARSQPIPGIVVAETWGVLRRAPWSLTAATVAEALSAWESHRLVLTTPPEAYLDVLRRGASLNLGGNVHDYLIAQTCAAAGLPLVTLDRGQAMVAGVALPNLAVTLLVPDR